MGTRSYNVSRGLGPRPVELGAQPRTIYIYIYLYIYCWTNLRVSYKKYEEFEGLTIFLMKCFCKFRGKNIIFENFGRPTIHILKILGKFSGNFLILENFGVAMPSSTHSSKWFCPYLDLNLPYPNHILA